VSKAETSAPLKPLLESLIRYRDSVCMQHDIAPY
jgi:hypothetical protein